jgi:hypothetical protein
VDTLVGDFGNPPSHLHVEIVMVGWLASQQSTQEVTPHILHTRFDLALGLCTIRPAQPRRKIPVPCEIEKDSVPNNLASLSRRVRDASSELRRRNNAYWEQLGIELRELARWADSLGGGR